MYEIFNGFMLGTVDIDMLNFGVPSPIPKLKGADSIQLFHPIPLINVPFKISVKAFATCLTTIVQHVIHKCQSAFIMVCYILEGLVVLQEIVHELKCTEQQAILLKLDFEKVYNRMNWEFICKVLL